MAIAEIFTWLVQEVFGDYVILSLIIFAALVAVLTLLRAGREIFVSILAILCYGLAKDSYIPVWLFIVVLMALGIILARSIMEAFFDG